MIEEAMTMQATSLDKLAEEFSSIRRLVETLANDSPKREDIASIRRLVELLARDALKRELHAVATTEERKKVYALSNGVTSTDDMAKKTGLSLRSVQDIVKKLAEMDLIITAKRGFPRRRFEWVPSEWRMGEVEEANVIRE